MTVRTALAGTPPRSFPRSGIDAIDTAMAEATNVIPAERE